MIALVHDAVPAAVAGRLPVLLDFCGALERRNTSGRAAGVWHVVTPEIGAAVAAHRAALGLTQAQAAGAAGVHARVFARIENPSGRRLERAFPVWRVLTWVMATGGQVFDLEG